MTGQNPYARVLTGNMVDNQKYATYLPAFYWLSALSQLIGLRDFPSWIAFWHVIFLAFEMGVAVLIYLTLDQAGWSLIGILGAIFWLFNRWTIDVLRVADIDFMPLFFLVGSLLFLRWRPRISLLLLSLSLAIKQITILLVPLGIAPRYVPFWDTC